MNTKENHIRSINNDLLNIETLKFRKIDVKDVVVVPKTVEESCKEPQVVEEKKVGYEKVDLTLNFCEDNQIDNL